MLLPIFYDLFITVLTYDRKHIKSSRKKYLAFGEEYVPHLFDTKTGGFVVYHRQHGRMELDQNLIIAEVLANCGFRVELLPAVKHVRFPDARINEKYWEFKTISKASPNISNAIQNHFERAVGQSPCIVLHVDQKFTLPSLFQGMEYSIKVDKDKYFERVLLLIGNDFAEFTVSQIRSGKYKKKVTRLI